MSNHVASETVVGEHIMDGHCLKIILTTWKDHPGRSYDVLDASTGYVLTEDESFDEYPSNEQLADLLTEEK